MPTLEQVETAVLEATATGRGRIELEQFCQQPGAFALGIGLLQSTGAPAVRLFGASLLLQLAKITPPAEAAAAFHELAEYAGDAIVHGVGPADLLCAAMAHLTMRSNAGPCMLHGYGWLCAARSVRS